MIESVASLSHLHNDGGQYPWLQFHLHHRLNLRLRPGDVRNSTYRQFFGCKLTVGVNGFADDVDTGLSVVGDVIGVVDSTSVVSGVSVTVELPSESVPFVGLTVTHNKSEKKKYNSSIAQILIKV